MTLLTPVAIPRLHNPALAYLDATHQQRLRSDAYRLYSVDNEANNTNLPLTVVQRLKSFCF